MPANNPDIERLRQLLREDPAEVIRRNPEHVRRLIDRARSEGKDGIADRIQEIHDEVRE